VARVGAASLRTRALSHGVFLVVFTVAAALGRATIVDGDSLSLVWPAAGVAVLWFVAAQDDGTADLGIAALGLGVASAVVHLLTGATPGIALTLVVANVAQAAVGAALLHRFLDLARGSSSSPFGSVRGVVVLLVAGAVASLVGAVFGATGFALVERGSVDGALVSLWWGRNMTGIVVVVATGHLVQTAVRSGRSAGWSVGRLGSPVTWTRGLEVTALLVGSVASLALFAREGRAFVALLGLVVWVGLRFPPVVVALHTALVGTAIVAVTLVGGGPFAEMTSAGASALDVQVLVATLAVIGLVLAGSLADQRRLVVRAEAAETVARASADLQAAVVGALDDGVVVVDRHGAVVTANAAARRLTQVVPGRLARSGTGVVRHPDGRRVLPAELPSVQAMREGHAPARDLVVHVEGSRTLVLSISAIRLEDVGGGGVGAVVVYRDVTSDRADRDELAGFAGSVAHDLRGPLTAIRGWLELARLAAEPDAVPGATAEPDLLACIEKAYAGTQGMAALIDDLLSHASRTGPRLDLAAVDLRRVVDEAAALSGAAEHVSTGELPAVRADEVLVRQLFVNLLGNALKYVATGVEPRVVVEAVDDGQQVTVTVTDNGLGIPEPEREAVFDKFHRAHPDRDDIPGSGLGLATCRMIVERHGGRIAAEAGPHGGSTFRLTLPSAATGPA
jgi:signal transduction histidine kinase